MKKKLLIAIMCGMLSVNAAGAVCVIAAEKPPQFPQTEITQSDDFTAQPESDMERENGDLMAPPEQMPNPMQNDMAPQEPPQIDFENNQPAENIPAEENNIEPPEKRNDNFNGNSPQRDAPNTIDIAGENTDQNTSNDNMNGNDNMNDFPPAPPRNNMNRGNHIELPDGNCGNMEDKKRDDKRVQNSGQVAPDAGRHTKDGKPTSEKTDEKSPNENQENLNTGDDTTNNANAQDTTQVNSAPSGPSENANQTPPHGDSASSGIPNQAPPQEDSTPSGMPAPQNANGEKQSAMPGMPEMSGAPGMNQGPGQKKNIEYSSANTVEGDITEGSYKSSSADENTLLADGKTASLSNISVEKTGDTNEGDADFYGVNAGILATNGADLTISSADINTDGSHANGVFSYGSGTSVHISDSTIHTKSNNSGGIMTTGGATMEAENLTVSTEGNSSAAIRSDRGGGTVTVKGGSYETSGVGSPAVYSTADITVSDAELTATNSEAVVIEGGNSVTLNNVTASGNDTTLNGQSTKNTNVLIYQSMSGDASEGDSSFAMTGGSLQSEIGSMFHITNTTTTISLENVELTSSGDLLDLSADSWGTEGKNGGNATVNLKNQTAEGDILVDDISSLTLNMSENTSYTGAINTDNNKAAIAVSLEEGSTWTLTGDSYISSFDGDISSVEANGYQLYVNGEEVI